MTFADESSEASRQSNAAHQHFIGILEEVKRILDPHDDLPGPSKSRTELESGSHITNLFENLTVEEPSAAFLKAHEAASLEAPEVKVNTTEQAEEFVAEPAHTEDEDFLAMKCVALDVMEIRGFLQALWTDYKNGRCELLSCSVTTHIAIRLVRRLQAEIEGDLGKPFDFAKSGQSGFCATTANSDEQPPCSKTKTCSFLVSKKSYKLADQLMLPVSRILGRFLEKGEVWGENSMPCVIPSAFGTYQAGSKRDEKSASKMYMEDETLLSEQLMDCGCLAVRPPYKPFVHSDMVLMLNEFREKHRLSLWGIFASQVFVDINHVLRQDCDKGFEELQGSAKEIQTTLEEHFKFHDRLPIVDMPTEMDKYLRNAQMILECMTKNDPADTARKQLVS